MERVVHVSSIVVCSGHVLCVVNNEAGQILLRSLNGEGAIY